MVKYPGFMHRSFKTLWALINDIIQRVLTLNKYEQRVFLYKKIKELKIPSKSKVLDFGCGTGLFAPVFKKYNFKYYGYDIDECLCDYSKGIYVDFEFTASKEKLAKNGPFDLILANCCFHHISDEAISAELDFIKSLLSNNGIFLMIDLLSTKSRVNLLRRMYLKLERGVYLRTAEENKMILRKHFNISKIDFGRAHLFSITNNILYNDLIVLECQNIK
jgi:2-polyprenyl-3-methyl-5-hydroxy-6-metoxy-1,4-benzoquinol methylase